MYTIYAAPDKVLCDGYAKTSVGGRVSAPTEEALALWKEMTEEEADILIAENTVEEE